MCAEIKICSLFVWNSGPNDKRFDDFFGGVFDGAKIGLCRVDHGTDKTQDTNPISAVGAVRFGHPIQILQFLTVENNEIFAFELGYSVNWETSPLVKTHEQVQQHDGKNHAVNDGACDQVNGS